MPWRRLLALPARRWSPLAALGGILALDALAHARSWPVPIAGLLDEPAHLLTSWLVVASLGLRTHRAVPLVLASSVAIDIDHIPLYLTGGAFAVDGGRPPTHCLGLLLVIGAAAVLPRAWLPVAATAGVLLHFVRDVATGPGLPLFWPLSDTNFRAPYWLYVAVLCLVAMTAMRRPRGAPEERAARSDETRERRGA